MGIHQQEKRNWLAFFLLFEPSALADMAMKNHIPLVLVCIHIRMGDESVARIPEMPQLQIQKQLIESSKRIAQALTLVSFEDALKDAWTPGSSKGVQMYDRMVPNDPWNRGPQLTNIVLTVLPIVTLPQMLRIGNL